MLPGFTPDRVSRLAIRPHRDDASVRILLSTEQRSWVYEDALLEIGRVGMLYDAARHSGKGMVLLMLHDAALIDQGGKTEVAKVAAAITYGEHVDFVLAPIRDLIDHARLSLCLTNDGRDWRSIDVSDLVSDFIMLDEYGTIAVRHQDRIVVTNCERLIDTLSAGQSVMQDEEGWRVDEQSIFVHFVPPTGSRPVVAVYSPLTHLTTCFFADGTSVDYDAGGLIVLSSRTHESPSFIGLSQSGHGYMSGPIDPAEIQLAR